MKNKINYTIGIIIIISILFYLVFRYYYEIKEGMIGSLVSPNYVPNTDMSFSTYLNNKIPPFDINYRCQNNHLNQYLGLPCWWRKYASNQIDVIHNYPDMDNSIPNNIYPRNTPLKYDGIYQKKYVDTCNNYIWKL